MNDSIKRITSAIYTTERGHMRIALFITLLIMILLILPFITSAQQHAAQNADAITIRLPDGSTALAQREDPGDASSTYLIIKTIPPQKAPPKKDPPKENTSQETESSGSTTEAAFVPESTYQWFLFMFGLIAQITFMSRFFVQWLVSERAKKSVIPNAFWWLSLAGSTMLFTYFTLRHDPIGMFGQCTGWLIYTRNIYFIYRPQHP